MHCESEKYPLQCETIIQHIYCAPPKIQFSTLSLKCIGGYAHCFGHGYEIPCDNLLYSYRVSIESDIPAKIVLYTLTSSDSHHITGDVFNQKAAVVIEDNEVSFDINFKRLVLVTNKECKLQVKIQPLPYVDSYAYLDYTLVNNRAGHLVVKLPESLYTSRPIPRSLCSKAIPPSVNLTGFKYCLTMNSVLTVTEGIRKDLRYPPYSVKLPQVNGVTTTVKYKISVKTSEGERADVTVTCIESLSRNRYSILKDEQGNNILTKHLGCDLEGSFVLTRCPVDVGLHIYTPYGFSGDIGDNPNTDLVEFIDFTLSYS